MSRLSTYGGRIIQIDGRRVIELRDPNDNARTRHQYRRTDDSGLERRALMADGRPFRDSGSPWEPYTIEDDLTALMARRGRWHPILDPLGL